MFKTKKGRIIFFSIVLATAVIAIILVTVLLPEPSLTSAKTNFDAFVQTYYRTDNLENNQVQDNTNFYETSVLNFNKLSSENMSSLRNYLSINRSLFLLEDFISNNILFTYRSTTFNANAKALENAKNSALNEYKNFYDYCDEFINPLLEQSVSISEYDQNEYAKRFIEKYKDITKANIEVFLQASEILSGSVLAGIEVNPYTITFVNKVCKSASYCFNESINSASTLLATTVNNINALKTYVYTNEELDAMIAIFDNIAEVQKWKS